MSGVKVPTKTVTQTEYDRMLREAARCRDLDASMRALERINKNLSDRLSTVNSRISDVTARADAANKKAAAASKEAKMVSDKITATIKATQKAFEIEEKARKEEIAKTRVEIGKDIEQTKAELVGIITDRTTALAKAMKKQQADNNARMEALANDINNIRDKLSKTDDDLATLLEIAGVYYDSAKAVIDTILETDAAHREALLPGQWDKLQTVIQNAKVDIEKAKGMTSLSAIAFNSARAMFDAIQDFYARLCVAEIEWQEAMENAKDAIASVQANAESSLKMTIDGETYDDMDEWSDGSLSEVIEQAENLADGLEKNGASMSVAALHGVVKSAESLSEETEAARTWAFIGISRSGDRDIMAGEIAKKLCETCALNVVQDAFQGGKEQAANILHLKNNANGIEVTIEFVPTVDDSGNPSFTVNTTISSKNMVNPEARMVTVGNVRNEVEKVLSEHGLESVGGAMIADDFEVVRSKDNYDKKAVTTTAKRSKKQQVKKSV